MTLMIDVNEKLDERGCGKPENEDAMLLFNFDDLVVNCKLAEIDRLACTFNEIVIVSHDHEVGFRDRVMAIGESLVQRVTYLLEPLAIVEADDEQGVLIRSNVPTVDDTTSYYEVRVKQQSCRLSRYSKSPDARRQVIPAQVTREVLSRLMNDFVECSRTPKRS